MRVGDTVRRPAGPWTPTVQRLLAHLRARGLTCVPEPQGLDGAGRDQVSHLPGFVAHHPLPDWVWDDDVLLTAARLTAALHEASRDFDVRDAEWQLPTHAPAEVICHNDLAPYNLVFTDRRPTGVTDWDTASPGPRSWDLAYLAYRLVPLTDPASPDGLASSVTERARRLRLLCAAYGASVEPVAVVAAVGPRLTELADLTEERERAGHTHLAGHAQRYRRDVAWVRAHADALVEPARPDQRGDAV